MSNKNKINNVKNEELGKESLSTEEVLKEISNAVNKERVRREKLKSRSNEKVYKLGEDIRIKLGTSDFEPPISPDLATLKSLIQTIVRQEIRRIQEE